MRPTRGPLPSGSSLRRTYTIASGWTMRRPCLTVASNSVDRLMRLPADSTAAKPAVTIRQSTHGGLCGADSTRWIARPGCASAAGNRERGLGAGCSAGKSACPWPRRSPRCVWHNHLAAVFSNSSFGGGLAAGRRGPQNARSRSQPHRRLSGDCLRVLTSPRPVKPRQSQLTHTGPVARAAKSRETVVSSSDSRPTLTRIGNKCWQPHRNLLASGSAVSA